jgi:hypothetical protein
MVERETETFQPGDERVRRLRGSRGLAEEVAAARDEMHLADLRHAARARGAADTGVFGGATTADETDGRGAPERPDSSAN